MAGPTDRTRCKRECLELIETSMIRTGLMMSFVQGRADQVAPPFDREAEEIIAGSAISGVLPPAWFDPSWCMVQLCAGVIGAMRMLGESGQMPGPDEPVPIEYLVEALTAAGFPGSVLTEDLLNLASVRFYASVEPECRRVRALHFRRRALERLVVLEVLLRTPESPQNELEEQSRRLGALLKAGR